MCGKMVTVASSGSSRFVKTCCGSVVVVLRWVAASCVARESGFLWGAAEQQEHSRAA